MDLGGSGNKDGVELSSQLQDNKLQISHIWHRNVHTCVTMVTVVTMVIHCV